MKALDYPLLTDENIQAEIVQALRKGGKQVRTVWDEGLDSREDAEILAHAHAVHLSWWWRKGEGRSSG